MGAGGVGTELMLGGSNPRNITKVRLRIEKLVSADGCVWEFICCGFNAGCY